MTGLDLETFLLLLRADLGAWVTLGLAVSVPLTYAGGNMHRLQNDIFTNSTTAAACGTATFLARNHQLLFRNGSDGCLLGDANTLAGYVGAVAFGLLEGLNELDRR